MTDQITVPRATWDAMREALEEERATLVVWQEAIESILKKDEIDSKTARNLLSDLVEGMLISEDKIALALAKGRGRAV